MLYSQLRAMAVKKKRSSHRTCKKCKIFDERSDEKQLCYIRLLQLSITLSSSIINHSFFVSIYSFISDDVLASSTSTRSSLQWLMIHVYNDCQRPQLIDNQVRPETNHLRYQTNDSQMECIQYHT